MMCYEIEALLLNLNFKFDEVSRGIHHYSYKDKLKLSLNFQLAAIQKKIVKNRLFDENIKIFCGNFFKVIYISILVIFKMLYKALILSFCSIVHHSHFFKYRCTLIFCYSLYITIIQSERQQATTEIKKAPTARTTTTKSKKRRDRERGQK